MKSPSMWTFWVSNSASFEYLFLMKKDNCNDTLRQWATCAMKTEVNGWQFLGNGDTFKWVEMAACPRLYWQRNVVSLSITLMVHQITISVSSLESNIRVFCQCFAENLCQH